MNDESVEDDCTNANLSLIGMLPRILPVTTTSSIKTAELVDESVEAIVKRLHGSPRDLATIRSLLKTLRTKNMRRPDLVVEFAPTLLKSSTLAENEAWSVQEQLFVAGLDTNDLPLAEEVLARLAGKFPGSTRVRRLTAMKLEAERKLEEALSVYNSLLIEDPSDVVSMKRRVCIWKARKETRPKAIEELNDYLTIFMADTTAWQELGDLYLDEQKYEYAAFCYEELLLAEPLNHHYHNRYAEILYTLGDYLTARKYFAHSLELNQDNNSRALFGLALTCKAIGSKKGGNKPKDNSELSAFAANQLRNKYSADAPEHLPLLKAVLDKL